MSDDAKAEFLRRYVPEPPPRKSGCLPIALIVMVAASICAALSMIYIGFALVFFAAVGLILFQYLFFLPFWRYLHRAKSTGSLTVDLLPTKSEGGFTSLQGFLAGGSLVALIPIIVGAVLAACGVPWLGFSEKSNISLLFILFAVGGLVGWASVWILRGR